MISSPWYLLLVGAVGASLTMICVWLVSIRIRNASYVDVAWALGIAGTAVV
jgi:steroid 5-alpha reductase family enzyme